ncbi:MAG: hypothetical protein ACXWQO_15450 [Bdellovibrionota bacterium]
MARRRFNRIPARGHYTRTNSPSGVFALYQNPSFGYGQCLAKPEESADTILSRNGISAVNASPQERTALAKGISQVNRLLGGPIPKEWRVNYQWVKSSGPWNSEISRAGFVTIKRPTGSDKGTLTGRMMHELGHKFGHANGAQKYQEYSRYTKGKRCYISTYCRKNINEEFAETFEAYVTQPDFLAKNCPDTFAFFQKEVFKNAKSDLASCSAKKVLTASNEEPKKYTERFETAAADLDQDDAVEERADDRSNDRNDDHTDDAKDVQAELTT